MLLGENIKKRLHHEAIVKFRGSQPGGQDPLGGLSKLQDSLKII